MLGISFKGQAKQAAPGGAGTVAQRALSLSSQGMAEPEIGRALQQEGYSPAEAERGMRDAMRTSAAPGPQGPRVMTPPGAPQAPGMQRPAYQSQGAPGAPYPRPVQQPPVQQQPFGEPEQPFGKSRYAPTSWGDDDEEMPDDDLDMEDMPKEKRLGPAAMFADLDDEKMPGPPDMPEKAPLRFAEPPLPKERDERDREVKDRRRREVEEMVEQIAEEKWQDMSRRVRDVDDRVEKMSTDMKGASSRPAGAVPEDLSALKNDISSLRQVVEETNARIDSLEEVVKGSLSPMIESIKKFRGAAMPERVERIVPPQPQARPKPAPEAASASDDSYDLPRYAPKRDEGE